MKTQIKSKQRVADHGEVFTAQREVNAMLDLVKQETERIESRFLEPACGDGNFLIEVLRRKLEVVDSRYQKNQIEWERYAIIAVSSIYGIDILEDNTIECRKRLLDIFIGRYINLFKDRCKDECKRSVIFILFRNILWGDTLSFINPTTKKPIVFSEWVAVNGDMINRRDYAFKFLVEQTHQVTSYNDDGTAVDIDGSVKDFPLIHFLKIGEDDTFETRANPPIQSDINRARSNNMVFDVIIGNPPYQLNDDGFGKSARPLYHKFIHQAKMLNPKYLCMIIPARWYSGGKGLDYFRKEMLNDNRIKYLVDFVDSRDCFPSVDIAGGICYFLWDKEFNGSCTFTSKNINGEIVRERKLNEFDVFIRGNVEIDIIHKVKKNAIVFMSNNVFSRNPFGFLSNFIGAKLPDKIANPIKLITSKGINFVDKDDIKLNTEEINRLKVIVSKASAEHAGRTDKSGMKKVFSRVEVLEPNVICSESYLLISTFESKVEADNLATYIKSNFFRFLVSSILLTQDIAKAKFKFVPIQDFSQHWSDEKLYEKYNITKEEIDYIESMIRPMKSNKSGISDR